MMNALLIFLGSGLGGVSRYGVSNLMYWLLGRGFPYGTLMVNATGCLMMGFLFAKAVMMSASIRSMLLIGFLGGYTTFSSFSIETLALFEGDGWFMSLMNVVLNVFLCLGLTWLGVLMGREA